MKHTLLTEWFLNESWGWRRYLADCFANMLTNPVRVVWWSIYGGGAVALGKKISQNMGLPQWPVVLLMIICVFLVVWGISLFWRFVLFPLPPCRNGCCRKMTDYTWPMGSVFGKIGWGWHLYWCGCGDRYLRRRRVFYYVSPDGCEHSYMKRTGFRKWVSAPNEKPTRMNGTWKYESEGTT